MNDALREAADKVTAYCGELRKRGGALEFNTALLLEELLEAALGSETRAPTDDVAEWAAIYDKVFTGLADGELAVRPKELRHRIVAALSVDPDTGAVDAGGGAPPCTCASVQSKAGGYAPDPTCPTHGADSFQLAWWKSRRAPDPRLAALREAFEDLDRENDGQGWRSWRKVVVLFEAVRAALASVPPAGEGR